MVERVGGNPAGHQDHRHAGAGMRRAAGEIEAAQIGAAVAGFESAEKFSVAGESVDRAIEHVVALVNVLRREGALENNARFDVWHLAGSLELFQNDAPILGQHFFPIVMRAQIGRVDEHVERFTARGRRAGFGASGGCEIARRIRRGLALLVNPIELLVRIAAENEIVVGKVIVTLVQPEVEHDPGTGGLIFAAPRESRADRTIDQFAMRADGVTVRNHGIERNFFARIRAHARDLAVARQDLLDFGLDAELDAEFRGELDERLRHRARAANRVPDTFVSLHVGDAAEHGGRSIGRRADVLGKMVDHLGDAWIGSEFAHRARDGAAHAHREDVAEHFRIERRLPLEHVAQTADRFVEKVTL